MSELETTIRQIAEQAAHQHVEKMLADLNLPIMPYSASHFDDADYGRIACPNCGSTQSKVYDSRPHEGRVWRKRKCIKCDVRYVTQEIFTKRLGAEEPTHD